MKYNFFLPITFLTKDSPIYPGHLQEISVIGRYKTSDIKIQLAAERNGTINVSPFSKFKECF